METQVRTPQMVFMQPQRLVVPLFQRPYVWNEENQWEPLWDDVVRVTAAPVRQFPLACISRQFGRASAPMITLRLSVIRPCAIAARAAWRFAGPSEAAITMEARRGSSAGFLALTYGR
jgi:hypothetical protein